MNNEKKQIFEHVLATLASKMNTDIPSLLRAVVQQQMKEQRVVEPTDEYVDEMQDVKEDETFSDKLEQLTKEIANNE